MSSPIAPGSAHRPKPYMLRVRAHPVLPAETVAALPAGHDLLTIARSPTAMPPSLGRFAVELHDIAHELMSGDDLRLGTRRPRSSPQNLVAP